MGVYVYLCLISVYHDAASSKFFSSSVVDYHWCEVFGQAGSFQDRRGRGCCGLVRVCMCTLHMVDLSSDTGYFV